MSSGQWTVFVLLLLLLFLEGLRSPTVKAFFTGLAVNPFKQAAS